MTELGDGIEQIMLDAIRYRISLDESDSMASSDRAWLLRYIDRQQDRLDGMRHAFDALNAGMDKLRDHDSPESDLLEAHATLDTLLSDRPFLPSKKVSA